MAEKISGEWLCRYWSRQHRGIAHGDAARSMVGNLKHIGLLLIELIQRAAPHRNHCAYCRDIYDTTLHLWNLSTERGDDHADAALHVFPEEGKPSEFIPDKKEITGEWLRNFMLNWPSDKGDFATCCNALAEELNQRCICPPHYLAHISECPRFHEMEIQGITFHRNPEPPVRRTQRPQLGDMIALKATGQQYPLGDVLYFGPLFRLCGPEGEIIEVSEDQCAWGDERKKYPPQGE